MSKALQWQLIAILEKKESCSNTHYFWTGGTNAITGVIVLGLTLLTFIISGQVPKNQMINKTSTRQIGVQEANIIDLVKKIISIQ